MTLILMMATFAVLTVLGVACRRARIDLEEERCDCLGHPSMAMAAGFGPDRVELLPAVPVLIGIDGTGEGVPADGRRRRGHLRVVKAG